VLGKLAQRPLLNIMAWAGALGVALIAFWAPAAQAATRSPEYLLSGRDLTAGGSPLAQPRFHIPAPPQLLNFGEGKPDRPVLNNVPMPIPTEVPYDQRPVDNAVAVFIPHGFAAPIPNALPGQSSTVTLTFDDCASAAQIQAVVAALAEVHERGVFFITGQCRDHFPWLVGALQASGHLVCNHTYSHPDLRRLSNTAVRSEIGRGVMAGCPYFRPPYGAWDGPRGRIARIAAEFGLQPMLWDVDSRDWAGAPADRIAALARSRGGVILLHLHGANTPDAIRLIG
jgi:peptidoglycan/xylan/chitin deacetylase (PgdA/CDA1 family)